MKTALFNGESIKSLNIPFDWDSDLGWDVYGEGMQGNELYARVAAVFAVMNLDANVLSSLPFVLLDSAGNIYDDSEDWQNKVGFFESPTDLLRRWRLSLSMTNAAYGFMERTRGKMNLRYIVPGSIKPIVDQRIGLVGFKRTVGAGTQEYSLNSGFIRHIFRLDHTTEILPSESTEFKAMMSDAGILFHADHFVAEFFKRGGIKPTILAVKGMISAEEKERVETYWDRFIKGFYKVSGKIFNAEMIDAKQVGDGVADLKDNDIYRQAIENIAMVKGIPISMLLSNAANFSTAEVYQSTWFNYWILPYSKFMAQELNKNLWSSFGLKMQFRPESVDPDAEETLKRSQVFQTLMQTAQLGNSKMSASFAWTVSGLPVPPEYDIESLDAVEEPEPESMVNDDPEPEEEKAVRSFTFDEFKELSDWRDIASRKLKRGESVSDMGWKRKSLPVEVCDIVDERLKSVKTSDDLDAAFDVLPKKEEVKTVSVKQDNDDEIKSLAEALNRLASKSEPQVINLSMSPIEITVNEKEVTVTPEVKEIAAKSETEL